ncbi:MAG: retropepsin-like aspartic protease [Chitinophagales bacterium]|nr:retropepsin-like aspartic protease [Chitinophagales bacterium]
MKNKCIATALSLLIILFSTFGCSQSGRRNTNHNTATTEGVIETVGGSSKKTVVKIKKVDGIYQIPVLVNGVKMFFIFDTGASVISISETEATFLYKQGNLTAEDIKGTAEYYDANGDISEGTIIVLKTVQIGDRILRNINASVVHNQIAPLLFGQSALEKFGKISIDNNREEITFE